MYTKIKFQAFLLLTSLLICKLSFCQIKDSYKIKIGNTEVYSLLDGTVEVNAEQLFNTKEPGKPSKLLSNQFINNPVEISINVFLIKSGTKNILVDAGAGELLGPSAGHIKESLASIGIKADEVSDILLTHIHADHSGGLAVAEEKVFPNATIHVNKKELDFWFDNANSDHASEDHMGANPKTFENAKKVLKPYIDSKKVSTFEGENIQILPNIYSYAVGGHTPGHTIYVLKDNGEELYFWGDVIHVAAIQLETNKTIDHFDVDYHSSDIFRSNFLKKAAKMNFLIAGAHISFPGFGRLKREGKHYVWYAVPYSISGRHK